MASSPESGTYRDSMESALSGTHSISSHSADADDGQVLVALSTEVTTALAEAATEATAIASANDDEANACNVHELIAGETSPQAPQQEQPSPLVDDIPEPIKVLDDIISEFEDASKPLLMMVNGENQSEDDGYMSLSRKNLPKKDSEELSQHSLDSSNEPSVMPLVSTPEVDGGASDTLANDSASIAQQRQVEPIPPEAELVQTTLPKMRPNCGGGKNYSSLPGCGGRSAAGGIGGRLENSRTRGSSCNGERNVLGIDIFGIIGIDNAVLRGGLAKLPERIVNEHPVTIYPGPSPSSNARRPQRIKSSVEKHKEVCHMLHPLSAIASSTSSSGSSASSSASSSSSRKAEKAAGKGGCKQRLPSEDDCSADDRSLSPQLRKPTAVAWEIHFDNRSKSKASLVSTSARRPPKMNTTNLKANRYAHESLRDQDAAPTPEMLNHCHYRNANMLGKGTFIIRRSGAKKPPRAMDIFQANGQGAANDSETETDDEPFVPAPGEALLPATNCRNTLKPYSADVAPATTSPRDKLSLNFEHREASKPSLLANTLLPEELLKAGYNSLRNEHIHKTLNKSASPEDGAAVMAFQETSESAYHMSAGHAEMAAGASTINGQEYELPMRTSNTTTPHTDLAPTLEEDEEQYSDFSYGGPAAPLKQIENNISALLRGDIAVARVGELTPAALLAQQALSQKRTLDFRPGVHKSESAKEMLLSQNAFGPLPPSPPSSSPDVFDYEAHLPPLPPSPTELAAAASAAAACAAAASPVCGLVAVPDLPKPQFLQTTAAVEVHHPHTPTTRSEERRRNRERPGRHFTDDLPLPLPPTFELPPAVPPHRHSANTMKSWSIDSNYKRRKSPKLLGGYGQGGGSGITTPTGPPPPPPTYDGAYAGKRYVSYGTKQRNLRQSPREEHRLQTSCSLPETPIFARGCDIPRTPFRRQNESAAGGSRTAPRSSTSHNINLGNSIVGIGGGSAFGTGMCRQRSINHALASNEMLRLSGAPGRGWYPKQRTMRPASTENIDRLASARVWDSAAGMSGTGHSRKPLTLPPNLTPSFLNKSPREALRRVTSLLITKKKGTKERRNKPYSENHNTIEANNHNYDELDVGASSNKDTVRSAKHTAAPSGQKPKEKKKSLFKNLWKRTKHVSLDQ